MNPPDDPTALAASEVPVSIGEVLAVVDELAIASAPTPRARILRPALISQLREAVVPSLGSTKAGRGSGRDVLIDTGAFTLWEDITGRIEALHEDLEGAPPVAGSHEQILLAWSRELAAADATAPHGLNQDALRFALHKVTRIRDLIRDHFDPPRTGDIPGARCPACDETKALILVDGEELPAHAIAWTYSETRGLEAYCRNCGRTWSGDLLHLMDRWNWASRRDDRLNDLATPLTEDDWTHVRLDLLEATNSPAPIDLWQQPGITVTTL